MTIPKPISCQYICLLSQRWASFSQLPTCPYSEKKCIWKIKYSYPLLNQYSTLKNELTLKTWRVKKFSFTGNNLLKDNAYKWGSYYYILIFWTTYFAISESCNFPSLLESKTCSMVSVYWINSSSVTSWLFLASRNRSRRKFWNE